MTRTCGKPWPRSRPCPRPGRSVSGMRKAHLSDTDGRPMRNRPATATTFQMEARGIEPRSENDSDTTTTCVGEASAVSPPWRLAGPGSEQPLPALTRPVRAPDHASPILRYVSAASGGLPLTQVREAEAYAASARFELAVINVPVVLPGD